MWREWLSTAGEGAAALAKRLGGRLPSEWQVVARNAATLAFQHGQLETARSSKATNAAGEAIPWYTYPAVEFFSSFDLTGRRVFEYGSGQSSLFWAKRAAEVVSVEHDAAWFRQVQGLVPPNVRLFLETKADGYVSRIETVGGLFDIVVIDGRFRTRCARIAPRFLAEGGLLVLDNTDWYPRTARTLREQRLFQIDFNGFGPINAYAWTTSVFLSAPTRLQTGFQPASPVGGIPNDGDATD